MKGRGSLDDRSKPPQEPEGIARMGPLDILKMLDRSNCGRCGQKTCLAFASLVYQRQVNPRLCPLLGPEQVALIESSLPSAESRDFEGVETLKKLMEEFAGTNLAQRAGVVGGRMVGRLLEVRCLGKPFSVDEGGGLHSDCHQNPWLHIPLLRYVRDAEGARPTGQWLRFEQLAGTTHWIPYFRKRCLQVLESLAGRKTELFEDIAGLFAEKEQLPGFEHDRSFLLRPLPLVPVIFASRRPYGELPAEVFVYFDRCCERNLDPESLFRIVSGVAQMFERIARRHG